MVGESCWATAQNWEKMTRDKVKTRFLMDKIGPIFPPHLSGVKVEVNLAARREGTLSMAVVPSKLYLNMAGSGIIM